MDSPWTELALGRAHPPGQDLEYPGFEVEDQVWNRLLQLRDTKIRKETEVKKRQRFFSDMKRKLDALQVDCDAVDSQVRPRSRPSSWRVGALDTSPSPSSSLDERADDGAATTAHPRRIRLHHDLC